MKSHDKYIERNDLQGATHLHINVHYDLGGTNYFNNQQNPRGYYLSVKPVNMSKNMMSYMMFSGQSCLLLETKRFTAKQFDKAIEMAKDYEDELIAAVVEKNKAA